VASYICDLCKMSVSWWLVSVEIPTIIVTAVSGCNFLRPLASTKGSFVLAR